MTKTDLYKGSIIEVFEDWQNCQKPIGLACLVEKKRDGLTFIIKDSYKTKVANKTIIYNEPYYDWQWQELPLGQYVIYNYERWDCYIIKSCNPKYKDEEIYSLNVRYAMGNYKDSNIITSKRKKKDMTEEEYLSLCVSEGKPIDTFIKVNGIEIF